MSSKNPEAHAQRTELSLTDTETFQKLFENQYLAVFRFIYGIHGGSIEEIEDLTTTTFLRAWKSRRRFQGNQASANGWLLKIARNLVIDTYRKNRRRGVQYNIENQTIVSTENLPEEQVAFEEKIQTLKKLLSRLPNRKKEIITLRYMLGWRVKDIAHHLEMSENHVSVLIRRTLKQIQDSWPMS
jgi:RNA polymerase sigma-70 factor (ECF subfamily)